MIKAVVFDLDDTLFPEEAYVKSGFRAVAAYLGDDSIYERLYALFQEDRQNVYQRMGFSDEECAACIKVYRQHMPQISLSAETRAVLSKLKENGYKLGIITDGRPEGQRNKIEALGLSAFVEHSIITDELGGDTYRKPNPVAFEMMREKLGVQFEEMMYVGDNPRKDFFIGSVYPIYTVRIQSGKDLYGDTPYYKNQKEKKRIKNLQELFSLL